MGKGNPWRKINATKRLWLLHSRGLRKNQDWIPGAYRYIPARDWKYMKYEKVNGSHRMGDLLVAYPEDRLHTSFMQRYPEFKEEPVDLDSFKPPTARRYAWRQLQLMQQGMSQKAARELLDAELKEWKEKQSERSGITGGSVIAAIQAEEEAVLQDALAAVRKGQRPEFDAAPTVNIAGLDIKL